MEARYDPAAIERRWYRFWEERGYFKPSSPSASGQPYCIMLPPPNVTGSLHMGHGFQQTLMDVLVRFHRMDGRRTLWQGGVDHAGIATQMVVTRNLEERGLLPSDLGRESFVKEVWKWKDRSGDTIEKQQKRLGVSIDWSRSRFTMDERFSQAVRTAFVRLHREGLIYRGTRLVNWDPQLLTAVSDLEVQFSDEPGKLWHFRYPLASGEGHVVVATTRPETMLGDVALAVHPDDARYRDLVGCSVRLPLVGRELPVIADSYVDPEFGSGCVKITPAHDFNDYEIGQRHGLPLINIFDARAKLVDDVPERYRRLDRFEARELVLEDMQAAGLLERTEERQLSLPRGDRSGAILEPWLTEQWFLRMDEMSADAREAVESGAIRFVPDTWKSTYFAWLREIRDWCISRQLWWGHRIPAWYDGEGNVYVAESAEQARSAHGLSEQTALRQDSDVLDTWFSSALWTFATLGWPEKTPELKAFHPTDVLVTGFDIIFFWVARMVMMTRRLCGQIPFKEVYVTGLVRDSKGQKMSKSKGNVLDPIDVIDGIDLDELMAKRTHGMMLPQLAEQVKQSTRRNYPDGIEAYGADALRFTFCALSSTSRSIRFDLKRIEGYRNFGNKLWNAARYVLSQADASGSQRAAPAAAERGDPPPHLVARWIESRLNRATAQVRGGLREYRFDRAARAAYHFVWHEYCDWFLEFCKPLLKEKETSQLEAQALRRAMMSMLGVATRLLHPIMPFLSEEIWQMLPIEKQAESLVIEPFPREEELRCDALAEREVAKIQAVIVAVRQIRGEMSIPPSHKLRVCLRSDAAEDRSLLENHALLVRKLARVETLQWLGQSEEAPVAVMEMAQGIETLVSLEGAVDRDAELRRLKGALERLGGDISKSQRKLANAQFVANAPEEVVTAERAHLERCMRSSERFTRQREALNQLG